MPPKSARRATWAALDASYRRRGISKTNLASAIVTVAAVLVGVLETEPTISDGRELLFRRCELAFGAAFAVEYAVRLWASAEATPETPWRARLRWVVSVPALIDLLSLAPALISLAAMPVYFLRLVRIVRIVRLAKLGRLSRAWSLMAEAFRGCRYELALTGVSLSFFLLFSAALMFGVEGEAQPETFGSIPRALWWAAITLTPVGGGDAHPITPWGKVVAGFIAVAGIGFIAVPTGIFGAAFTEALRKQRTRAAPASGGAVGEGGEHGGDAARGPDLD
jgi:voltage-gated potassium channel